MLIMQIPLFGESFLSYSENFLVADYCYIVGEISFEIYAFWFIKWKELFSKTICYLSNGENMNMGP